MRLRPFALAATVLAASVLLAAKTQAGLSISVMTEETTGTKLGSAIYRVDVGTGVATKVGDVPSTGSRQTQGGTPNSLGQTNSGYYYTTGENGNSANQFAFHFGVDKMQIAAADNPGGVSGADAFGKSFFFFSDGTTSAKSKFGIISNIDKASSKWSVSTVDSNVGNVSLGDIAVDASSKGTKGYIAYQDRSTFKNYIGTIDLVTGSVSLGASIGQGSAAGQGRINGLAFTSDGKLWATTRDGATGDHIYEVDTGTLTLKAGGVDISGFMSGFHSTDAAAVPEPATLAVFGLGSMCSLGLVRRFRRKAAQA